MYAPGCFSHEGHRSLDKRGDGYRNTEKRGCVYFSPAINRVKMGGEQKQQQNQKHGNVLFHCFIEHGGPAPQAANQIRGLRNGHPMESRDLVTGISCSPKVWVRGAELAGSILPCEWSVQLSVTLQLFGHRINQKQHKEHRLYRLHPGVTSYDFPAKVQPF